MLSQIKKDNPIFRLDSGYYDFYYLKLLDSLNYQKTENALILQSELHKDPTQYLQRKQSIPCLTRRNISKGRVIKMRITYPRSSKTLSVKERRYTYYTEG